MNTGQIWQTTSQSLDDTLNLASAIGSRLRGGEVIELISDLGGGKTAFVRGLAAGMGSSDPVSSPTFTISNQYAAGALTLYHFDFYRLGEAGIMRDELQEILQDKQAVTVVEWAGIVTGILPAERLSVTIKASGETERQVTFRYPPALDYLIKGDA